MLQLSDMKPVELEQEILLNKLFEVFQKVDKCTVTKDCQSLRLSHYENMEWLEKNGLMESYYKYFAKQLKREYADNRRDIADVWSRIREMGGCDAKKGTYDDGWDEAIRAVDELLTETFGNLLNVEPYEGEDEENGKRQDA